MGLYSKEITVKDIEDLLSDLSTIRKKDKKNTFQMHSYVSLDQYKMLETGADQFDKALIHVSMQDKSEREIRLSIVDRDFREFIFRNKDMNLNDIENYRKCLYGDGDLSPEEYFFYNYCHINGKLPVARSFSKDTMERYRAEVLRIRENRKKRKKPYDAEAFLLEKPRTPQQSFYGKLRNRYRKNGNK